MAAEKSPTGALADLARRQKNLKRKIGRAEESGDLARLLLYHAELEQIGRELERLSVECGAKRSTPAFRRSYALEAFMEGLSAGPASCSLKQHLKAFSLALRPCPLSHSFLTFCCLVLSIIEGSKIDPRALQKLF